MHNSREQICLAQGFTPFGEEVVCLQPESETVMNNPTILSSMQLGKIKAFETIMKRITEAESAFERGKRKRIKVKDETGETIGRIPVTEDFMDDPETKQETGGIIFESTEPRRAEIARLNRMWEIGPAAESEPVIPSTAEINSFFSETPDEQFTMDFGLGDPFEP